MSGCPAGCLVVEVTETHLLTVGEALRRDLDRLRAMGVRLSADDYGTGFSALSQIIELDVDSLKIDRSFVMAMDTNERAQAVVQAVIGLGVSLGLDVVAEGVERVEHADALAAMGCRSAQGYLWSPAIAPDALERLLRAWPDRAMTPDRAVPPDAPSSPAIAQAAGDHAPASFLPEPLTSCAIRPIGLRAST